MRPILLLLFHPTSTQRLRNKIQFHYQQVLHKDQGSWKTITENSITWLINTSTHPVYTHKHAFTPLPSTTTFFPHAPFFSPPFPPLHSSNLPLLQFPSVQMKYIWHLENAPQQWGTIYLTNISHPTLVHVIFIRGLWQWVMSTVFTEEQVEHSSTVQRPRCQLFDRPSCWDSFSCYPAISPQLTSSHLGFLFN